MQLAPITVLEFARLATEAGGEGFALAIPRLHTEKSIPLVPEGVLTILPGLGPITGKEVVQNPLIRKVDITVSLYLQLLTLGLEINPPLGWDSYRTQCRKSRWWESYFIYS